MPGASQRQRPRRLPCNAAGKTNSAPSPLLLNAGDAPRRPPRKATGKGAGDGAGRSIAAIARAHGLIVVTHNTGEFERVPDLALEDWQQELGRA